MEDTITITKREYDYLKNCSVFVETIKKTLFGDYEPKLHGALGDAERGQLQVNNALVDVDI